MSSRTKDFEIELTLEFMEIIIDRITSITLEYPYDKAKRKKAIRAS